MKEKYFDDGFRATFHMHIKGCTPNLIVLTRKLEAV